MSNVKLRTPSNGSVTLSPQDTASDVVLTVPSGGAATMLTSIGDVPAANLTGNVAAARITNALNASGSAPIYACRAWVNFANNLTIRASGNVSSVSRRGTGQYTVNFSRAMPDANYALVGTAESSSTSVSVNVDTTGLSIGTSSINIRTSPISGTVDRDYIHVGFFR